MMNFWLLAENTYMWIEGQKLFNLGSDRVVVLGLAAPWNKLFLEPNIYNKWTEEAIKAQISVTMEWQISVAQYLSDALRIFTNNDGTFRDSYSACEYLTIKIRRKFGGGWICNFGKFKIYESEDFSPSFSQVPLISDFVYFSLDNEESVMIIRIV